MADNDISDVPTNDEEGRDPEDAPTIRFRGADGEWHDLEVERRQTGDPELDALWDMSISDLDEILDDESHPLHEKSKQVSAEAMKPLVNMARRMTQPLSEQIGEHLRNAAAVNGIIPKVNFDTNSLFSGFDTSSWVSRLMPHVPPTNLPKSDSSQNAEPVTTPSPSAAPALKLPERHWIDLDSPEPPEATVAEFQQASEAISHGLLEKQVEVLSKLLAEAQASAATDEEALEISKRALHISEDSLVVSKGSRTSGWVAAGVAGFGIVVALLIAFWPTFFGN